MNFLEAIFGHGQSWNPPDTRAVKVPASNDRYHAVLSPGLGGGVFGTGIGSGVGRVGGGTQPPVLEVRVPPNAWSNIRPAWDPFVFDYSTPGAGRQESLGLDAYARHSLNVKPTDRRDNHGNPITNLYGGVSGSYNDGMGYDPIPERALGRGDLDNRSVGGMIDGTRQGI